MYRTRPRTWGWRGTLVGIEEGLDDYMVLWTRGVRGPSSPVRSWALDLRGPSQVDTVPGPRGL